MTKKELIEENEKLKSRILELEKLKAGLAKANSKDGYATESKECLIEIISELEWEGSLLECSEEDFVKELKNRVQNKDFDIDGHINDHLLKWATNEFNEHSEEIFQAHLKNKDTAHLIESLEPLDKMGKKRFFCEILGLSYHSSKSDVTNSILDKIF